MKKILKDAAILFTITLISGILLGAVYKITKDPIAEQNEKTKVNAYHKVFDKLSEYIELDNLSNIQSTVDAAGYSAVNVDEVVEAYDSDKNMLGYIITVTDSEGFGGNIKFTVGIDVNGIMTGMEILDINETAGLGMKAKNADFKDQFAGVNADTIEYTKNGATEDNQIDAISGATITTKAITNGVNGAIAAYKTLGGAANE